MYCRQCGYNNDQYSKLCHRCGSVLREAEEHYDLPQKEQSSEEQGVLKYARKGDDLVSLLKAPFRQLARVTENHRRRWPILITIVSVIVICVAVWLIVLSSNACHEAEVTVYGNTPANTAFNALAAADDDYIYYTCPFGENPGLYRLSISTGEILKISYHCLESLSVVDGWVYGVGINDGTVVRVSYDGLSSQTVIEETNVKHPVVVGDHLYYIGMGCRLYRADISTLSRRSLARTEQLTDTLVSEFVIYEDFIYFIEMTAEDYEQLFTVTSTITPPPYEDENGKKVEPEPYTVSELVVPEGADVPNNAGCIRRMSLDGRNESEILGTPVLNLTAGSGYLFFQTNTAIVISATDIDPNAPADMPYELPAKKSWRLSLETLKYSTLLDANIADSPLMPTDDGWVYYIATDGNLERVSLKGGERYNVLTYKQDTDRFCICGGRMFVMTDDETRMISMLPDGTDHVDLCERIPEVEAGTAKTDTSEQN